MCCVKVKYTLSTESTLPISKDCLRLSFTATQRTRGPFDLLPGKIAGTTLTVFTGAKPINASNVALPPFSKDDFD